MKREDKQEGLRISVSWPDGGEKASVDLLAIVERLARRQKLILEMLTSEVLWSRLESVAIQNAHDSVGEDLVSIDSLYEAMTPKAPSVALRAPGDE